jgi:hypothetical protein
MHEAGHVISGSMPLAATDILHLDSTSMNVAFESKIVKNFQDVISQWMEVMKTVSDDDLRLIMEYLRKDRLTPPEDRAQFLQWISSPAVLVNLSFQGTVELLQILGFFASPHPKHLKKTPKKKPQNVLYINLLSDAAYSIGNGFPVRLDHIMEMIESIPNLDNNVDEVAKTSWTYASKIKPAETSMNIEFYRALFWAYGSTIPEYEARLHSCPPLDSCWIFPYKSLTHALKRMYKMNCTMCSIME